jgi:pimeloyl-ACP methyl ester carboxylesterase
VKSLFLTQQGCFFRYQHLHGEGPVCVYLHGLGSASSADFPSIVASPKLAGYQHLLVDFLGLGFSDKPEQFSYTLEDHAHTVITLLDHL